MVVILLSYWEGRFSGATLVSRRVYIQPLVYDRTCQGRLRQSAQRGCLRPKKITNRKLIRALEASQQIQPGKITLPPIIMEVENSPFGDKPHIFQDPIFHFHDYGRKSKMEPQSHGGGRFRWFLRISMFGGFFRFQSFIFFQGVYYPWFASKSRHCLTKSLRGWWCWLTLRPIIP